MPSITVLYFAGALTATRKDSERIELPEVEFKLSSLEPLLVSKYPATNLEEVLKTSRWSVDAEMVDDPNTVILKGGEEVAVICPVSGG